MEQDSVHQKLACHVHRHFGLDFKRSQWKSMEHHLSRAAIALQRSPRPSAVLEWLSSDRLSASEYEALTQNLTVGETYFFREKAAFTLLRNELLKPRSEATHPKFRQLRIWSAGCSSGEEPYSIAMTLKEFLPDLDKWDIRITATDLNAAALQKAKAARYRSWSFRDTPEFIKELYFIKKGDTFELIPEIKKMVTFQQLNLIGESYAPVVPYPGSCDIIFCRNVLMYFSPEVIEAVAARFWEALTAEGWFVTSQVELNEVYFGLFVRRQHGTGLFYQKSNKAVSIQLPPVENYPVPLKKLTPGNRPKRQEETSDGKRRAVAKRETPLPGSEKYLAEKKAMLSLSQIRSLFEAQNYAQCIRVAERYVEEHGYSVLVGEMLARAYANTGRYAEAEQQLTGILTTRPDYPAMLLLLADILAEQGRTEEADAQLVKVLYLEPDNKSALFTRSRLLTHLGKTELSQKHLRRLLSLIDLLDDAESLPELDGLSAGSLRRMALSETS
ncbi:MAG: tetratricopeptide repeat protein [Balneolales bacterium]|nr:tetratricopeptide repeat protein [Balneolales bacterium]